LVNKSESVCSRIYKYLQKYIYLFIDRLYKIVIYFLSIRYYRSSSTRLINSPKKMFSFRYFYFLINYSFLFAIFLPYYYYYFLFHDLIEVRVIFRIRVFGTSIAGLITIVAHNRSNKKNVSLLFCDLLRT
jgi:hypothetical protein